jgi:hypothetical protein
MAMVPRQKDYNDFRFEPIERSSGHRLEDGDLVSESCSGFAFVVIFERSNGGVRATPAGRHLLRMTRYIFRQIEALVASTRATGCG